MNKNTEIVIIKQHYFWTWEKSMQLLPSGHMELSGLSRGVNKYMGKEDLSCNRSGYLDFPNSFAISFTPGF